MLVYVLHTFYFVLLIGVLGACLLFCCWGCMVSLVFRCVCFVASC